MLSAQFAAPLPTADIDQPGGFSSIPSLTCSEPTFALGWRDGEKISLEKKDYEPEPLIVGARNLLFSCNYEQPGCEVTNQSSGSQLH